MSLCEEPIGHGLPVDLVTVALLLQVQDRRWVLQRVSESLFWEALPLADLWLHRCQQNVKQEAFSARHNLCHPHYYVPLKKSQNLLQDGTMN